MSNCLYTEEELIQKLKDLNTAMDDGTTRSKLDTSQSDSEFSQSLRQMERQYEKYLALLQTCYPAAYRTMFGKSVIRFRGNSCQ
jgi:hypothetical protein